MIIVRSRDLNALVISSRYEEKDAIKAVRGTYWDRKGKVWIAPATRNAARELRKTGLIAEASPGFWELLRDSEHASMHEYRPSGLKSELWDHQVQAVAKLCDLQGGMLAMDMGTGKTITALALAQHWGARRVLVSCPNNVVGVWPREIRQHLLEEVTVARCHGGLTKSGRPRSLSVKAKLELAQVKLGHAEVLDQACYVIINHESTWREPFAQWALGAGFDLLILDESHRAKAPGGRLSRFLAKLGAKVPHRLALTGTPLPHSPLDAYAQFKILDPSIYGNSVTVFRREYAVMGGYQGRQIMGWRNQEDFTNRFARISFQVKKEECLELPPITDVVRLVGLEPKAQSIYEDLEQRFIAELKHGTLTVPNALVKLLRLQQVAAGFLPTDLGPVERVSEAKQAALRDFLEDLPHATPVVVFCRFVTDLEQVESVAVDLGAPYGELSGRRKDLTSDAQMRPSTEILGAQLQSGGVGIDLTRACHAVYFSHGWNLGDLLQSRARLDRPGQKRPVTYTHLLAEGTVDEIAYKALRSREKMVEGILERARSGELTDWARSVD